MSDIEPIGPHKRLRRLSAEHRGNLYRVLRNHAAATANPAAPVIGLYTDEPTPRFNGSRIVALAAWLLIGGLVLAALVRSYA